MKTVEANNYTLKPEVIAIGRKMATHDGRSFSNFINQLIKEEAKRRGIEI